MKASLLFVLVHLHPIFKFESHALQANLGRHEKVNCARLKRQRSKTPSDINITSDQQDEGILMSNRILGLDPNTHSEPTKSEKSRIGNKYKATGSEEIHEGHTEKKRTPDSVFFHLDGPTKSALPDHVIRNLSHKRPQDGFTDISDGPIKLPAMEKGDLRDSISTSRKEEFLPFHKLYSNTSSGRIHQTIDFGLLNEMTERICEDRTSLQKGIEGSFMVNPITESDKNDSCSKITDYDLVLKANQDGAPFTGMDVTGRKTTLSLMDFNPIHGRIGSTPPPQDVLNMQMNYERSKNSQYALEQDHSSVKSRRNLKDPHVKEGTSVSGYVSPLGGQETHFFQAYITEQSKDSAQPDLLRSDNFDLHIPELERMRQRKRERADASKEWRDTRQRDMKVFKLCGYDFVAEYSTYKSSMSIVPTSNESTFNPSIFDWIPHRGIGNIDDPRDKGVYLTFEKIRQGRGFILNNSPYYPKDLKYFEIKQEWLPHQMFIRENVPQDKEKDLFSCENYLLSAAVDSTPEQAYMIGINQMCLEWLGGGLRGDHVNLDSVRNFLKCNIKQS